MKEIINRLHKNRQIELAKRILESEGYSVTLSESITSQDEYHNSNPEEHPGWDYLPKGYNNQPWEPDQYRRETNEFYLHIFPPEEGFSPRWAAGITAKDSDLDRLDTVEDRFASFAEAEQWMKNYLEDNGYSI